MSDFNPKAQVKQIRRGQGSFQYLQVNDRVIWFRHENVEGIVDSELVQYDPDRGVAVVKATVSIPGKGSATGLGSACRADLQAKADRKSVQPDQVESYVEFAETAALGRALGRLGYGTDDALSEDGPVDSPREVAEAPEPVLATPQQVSQIRGLTVPAGKTVDTLCGELRVATLGNLTSERADKVIARLQDLARERAAGSAA